MLGEFSIVEWMLDGAVIRVFTKSAFISSNVIDSAFNLFLSEKQLNINSLNRTNVFYYSGNLLNTNETKEIIN